MSIVTPITQRKSERLMKNQPLAGQNREILKQALWSAISNIEIPFDISVKAYQVKLDGMVNGDTYQGGKASNRIGSATWTNILSKTERHEIWAMFVLLFEDLKNDAGLYQLEESTFRIFDALKELGIDHDQYMSIRNQTTKLLDLYGWIEVMATLRESFR